MSEQVDVTITQGVAVLRIRTQGAQALTPALRAEVMNALDEAEEDDRAQAILVIGADGRLPSGADVAELQNGEQEPYLRDLCGRFDYADKPVVMALDGIVLGAAAELALAAHYRVARRSVRLAMPDCRLGVPPGGGATQRLPRVVGAGPALDVMLGGAPVALGTAPFDRLVDSWSDGDLKTDALLYAQSLGRVQMAPKRLRDGTEGFSNMTRYLADVKARKQRFAHRPDSAEARIVDLVEVAPMLPFTAGIAMEEDAYNACRSSSEAAALLHVSLSEQRARRASPRLSGNYALKTLAVLGSGTLSAQLVASALRSGLHVQWGTRDLALMQSGLAQLDGLLDQISASLPAGRFDVNEARERLLTGDSSDMTKGADMIVHGARGQADVPAPADIVRAVAHPGKIGALGLRFSEPVHGTRLVEIAEALEISDAERGWAHCLAERLGKVTITTQLTQGSVAGRLWQAALRAADALVDMGAHPAEVDAAVRQWGWPRAPFLTQDMAGLSRGLTVRDGGGHHWASVLAEAGRGGAAQGKGFYRWADGKPQDDSVLRVFLDRNRSPQKRATDEMVQLILGAMANEGLRLLQEGAVARAEEIDLVAVLGLEMPRHRGGPFFAVEQIGMFKMQKKMSELDHPDKTFWRPNAIWPTLVKNGSGFAEARF